MIGLDDGGIWRCRAGLECGGDRNVASLTFEDIGSDGDRSHEDYDQQTFILRAGSDLGDDGRLDFAFRYADADVDSPYDFPFGTVLPPDDNIHRSRKTSSASAGRPERRSR